MSKKEQAIKQALASVNFEGLNVSDSCIKEILNKEKEEEKKMIKQVKFNG